MSKTFGEMFMESQGDPFDFEGEKVHCIFKQPVEPGSRVKVVFGDHCKQPVQGLGISAEKGEVEVNGTRSKKLVLWVDSAPGELVMTFQGKKASKLKVWNCWRDQHGVTQAWVGNAGMRVRELEDGRYQFLCNSSPSVTFSDLSFELEFLD